MKIRSLGWQLATFSAHPSARTIITIMLFATLRLRQAVNARRLAGERQYQIARAVGIAHPERLSTIVNGARSVHRSDPQIIRLIEYLGISFDEAFEEIADTAAAAPASRAVPA